MKKIFIDCDVILDLLLNRKNYIKDAQILFTHIDLGDVKGYTSGLALANIYYILAKLTSKKYALNNIRKLDSLLFVTTINDSVIKNALSSSFPHHISYIYSVPLHHYWSSCPFAP